MGVKFGKAVFGLAAIMMLFYVPALSQANTTVTKEMAIKKAEQFIADNGYTTKPANKSKIIYELYDIGANGNVDTILRNRNNNLLSKAFCISEDNEDWHIGFLGAKVKIDILDSVKILPNLPGRAVIVSKNGKEIRIAHKTPLFSHFQKL